jgi:hypothetical protein
MPKNSKNSDEEMEFRPKGEYSSDQRSTFTFIVDKKG